jgi:hypothetical protein
MKVAIVTSVAILLMAACQEKEAPRPAAPPPAPGTPEAETALLEARKCTLPPEPWYGQKHPLDAFEPEGQTIVRDSPTLASDLPGTPYVRIGIADLGPGYDIPLGAIHAKMTSLRPCYVEALTRRPGLVGGVQARFDIDLDGTVIPKSIELIPKRFKFEPLLDCIEEHLLCTRFMPPSKKSAVLIQLVMGIE